MKLILERIMTEKRIIIFLTQHVIKLWNSLSQNVVLTTSLAALEKSWPNPWKPWGFMAISLDGEYDCL